MKNIMTCVDCGCIIENDDFYTLENGDVICADCFDSDYFICEDCGEVKNINDLVVVGSDTYICEDCAESGEYEQCSDCGEWFSIYDVEYVENCGYVCSGCLDWSYYFCVDCGCWYHENDWDFDYDCCMNCAEDKREESIIKPYHFHKGAAPIFFGSKSASIIKGYLGIEWELDFDGDVEDLALSIHDILGEHVYFEHDCSIDGCECIFQPHTYEELKYNPMYREAFDEAKSMGAQNYNTGLHVHVSRSAFGETIEEQNENIAKICLLHNNKDAYERMVKLSRRGYDASDWARAFSWDKCDEKERAKRYVDSRCGSHGVAINCSNSATIEFRLGKGTVDFDEAMAWIDIVVMLVIKSRKLSMDDAGNFDKWFENANDEIKAYMLSRGVEWNAPVVLTHEDYIAIIQKLMDNINATAEANSASPMDYNTMLYALAGLNEGTRRALGYL